MSQLRYTQSTATEVQARMTATQNANAQGIRSQGDAEAQHLISEAESIRDQTLSFASQVAEKIRRIGRDEEAAAIAQFASSEGDQAFAIFLRQLEAMEQSFGQGGTTFYIDARYLNPFNVWAYGPGPNGDISRTRNTPLGAFSQPAAGLLPVSNAGSTLTPSQEAVQP